MPTVAWQLKLGGNLSFVPAFRSKISVKHNKTSFRSCWLLPTSSSFGLPHGRGLVHSGPLLRVDRELVVLHTLNLALFLEDDTNEPQFCMRHQLVRRVGARSAFNGKCSVRNQIRQQSTRKMRDRTLKDKACVQR